MALARADGYRRFEVAIWQETGPDSKDYVDAQICARRGTPQMIEEANDLTKHLFDLISNHKLYLSEHDYAWNDMKVPVVDTPRCGGHYVGMRCCQGHTFVGIVDWRIGISLSAELLPTVETLWHATWYESLREIFRHGLQPGGDSHHEGDGTRVHTHLQTLMPFNPLYRGGSRQNCDVRIYFSPQELCKDKRIYLTHSNCAITRDIIGREYFLRIEVLDTAPDGRKTNHCYYDRVFANNNKFRFKGTRNDDGSIDLWSDEIVERWEREHGSKPLPRQAATTPDRMWCGAHRASSRTSGSRRMWVSSIASTALSASSTRMWRVSTRRSLLQAQPPRFWRRCRTSS